MLIYNLNPKVRDNRFYPYVLRSEIKLNFIGARKEWELNEIYCDLEFLKRLNNICKYEFLESNTIKNRYYILINNLPDDFNSLLFMLKGNIIEAFSIYFDIPRINFRCKC